MDNNKSLISGKPQGTALLDDRIFLTSIPEFNDLPEKEKNRFSIVELNYQNYSARSVLGLRFEYEDESGQKRGLKYNWIGDKNKKENHFFCGIEYEDSYDEVKFSNLREAIDYCNDRNRSAPDWPRLSMLLQKVVKNDDGDEIILNRWNKIAHWSPAQLCYYFLDANGGRWCIYLRWDGKRGDEPWSAELVRCDKDWILRFDHPDTVDLLKENEHVPGTVVGYYLDMEYPLLQVKVLEIVKKRFPNLDFPNVQ